MHTSVGDIEPLLREDLSDFQNANVGDTL